MHNKKFVNRCASEMGKFVLGLHQRKKAGRRSPPETLKNHCLLLRTLRSIQGPKWGPTLIQTARWPSTSGDRGHRPRFRPTHLTCSAPDPKRQDYFDIHKKIKGKNTILPSTFSTMCQMHQETDCQSVGTEKNSCNAFHIPGVR